MLDIYESFWYVIYDSLNVSHKSYIKFIHFDTPGLCHSFSPNLWYTETPRLIKIYLFYRYHHKNVGKLKFNNISSYATLPWWPTHIYIKCSMKNVISISKFRKNFLYSIPFHNWILKHYPTIILISSLSIF